MNTVWVFGDSYSEDFDKGKWAIKYMETLKHVPKSYGQILSEKFDYNFKNQSIGGSDNYQIFEEYCKNAHLITENDIVVFGWSSAIRFRLITKDDEWLPLIPLHANCIERFNDISQQTIDEIHVNRMSEKCVEEMNNWINLINIQKHISVHWTPFQYPNEYKPIPIKIFGPETVTIATNGKVNDGHFSEKGHQELAEQIYNLYRKEMKKRLSPSKSNRSLI